MRFFAKIFLRGTVVLSLTFLISGYFFMNYSLEKNLERETNFALKQYQYDKFTVQAEMLSNSNLFDKISGNENEEVISSLVEGIDVATAFYTEEGTRLYSEIENMDDSFVKELSDTTQNYNYYKNGNRSYLLIGSMISQNNQKLYFITKSDISEVFEQQKILSDYFNKIYGIALGLGVMLLFLLSVFVTVPLKKMTRAANRIASGHYNERIERKGKDEIGELSRSFNSMAKAVEERINELSEEATRKEDFVANFAHELKTPMTSVIGYADMIYQNDMPREETKKAAWFIWNEGMRLEALSHKLMEFTVLNRQDFVLQEMSVKELLQDITESMEGSFCKNHITFRLKAEDAYIKVEYDLLKTLLLNLIDNSIKADAKCVEVLGKKEADCYTISVKDDGRGIPRGEISRITEPFYMVDKSRSRQKYGAGLGLAMAVKIAKIHDSELIFTSETNQGTTVSFSLKCEEGGAIDEE